LIFNSDLKGSFLNKTFYEFSFLARNPGHDPGLNEDSEKKFCW